MTYSSDSLLRASVPPATGWIAVLAAHGAFGGAEAIVASYAHWCGAYGLDANLALAQGCQESAYYTSARWHDFNPAGLGVTSSDAVVAPFASLDEGIRAHCEHLLCYVYDAATCPADHAALADRRHFFHDGIPTLSALERPGVRQWAVPGDNYIAAICAIANAVIGSAPPVPTPQPGGTVDIDSLGIIDIRDQMAKAPGQGAGYKSPKSGVIVHYNGPPSTIAALDRFISDASFHIGPYLREYTIAYIYGIGDEPDDHSRAPIYLMRDPDDVCWHCGSWPENATYTPIAFAFGDGQNAGPGQLLAVNALVAALMQRDGFDKSAVKGHQEVSSTSCPGTLMNDFIYPFRAGGPVVSDYIKFDQTGHGIGGGFRAYWEHNGGVPVFGYPVTEEVQEKGTDGKMHTVQYFERSRFEYHPEFQPPNDVLLTRYGAEDAAKHGYSGPGIPTTAAPPMKAKKG